VIFPDSPTTLGGPRLASLGVLSREVGDAAGGLVLVLASRRRIGAVEFGVDRVAVQLTHSLMTELGNLPVCLLLDEKQAKA